MGIIKSLLREELENSIRMLKNYKKALKKFPGGSIVRKKIRGHSYYYLAFRDGKKVRFIYKGKKLSKEVRKELNKSRQSRLKYKKLVEKLNKRIKYLRKVLRGKEDA